MLSVSFPCSMHTLSQCNAARFLTATHTTLFLALSHSLCLSRFRTPQHKGKSTRAQCRYTGCLARTRRYVRARSLSLRFGCRACTAIFSLFPQTNVINCKQENSPPCSHLPPATTHTHTFVWLEKRFPPAHTGLLSPNTHTRVNSSMHVRLCRSSTHTRVGVYAHLVTSGHTLIRAYRTTHNGC